jgi:1-pyrroline-5-carboxylate dehydrogenase
MDAATNVPPPVNEPVLDYAPGSTERTELEARLKQLAAEQVELTMAVGGEHRLGGGQPQCGHDARPEQDRLPGGDRLRVRDG